MDGVTGFSPDKAFEEIRNISIYGVDVGLMLDSSTYEYYKCLKQIWCSPKAVDFSKRVFLKLEKCCDNLFYFYEQLVLSLQSAYNTIATANGMEPLNYYEDKGPLEEITETEKVLLSVSPTGIVGMNKTEVQDITNQFCNYIKTDVKTEIEKTPLTVSFYDPGEEVIIAYKERVNNIVNNLITVIDELAAEITTIIQEEVDTAQISAKAAAEAISNNGTESK